MSKNIRSPINFTGVTALDGTDKKFEDVVNKINPPSDAKEVLVILAVSGRTKDADYASGKIACVRRGFYCQAIQAKERSEDDPSRGMSILTNIARQIVNKRGEFLWNFNAHELCPAWKNKTILAIGYDVYHGKAEVTASGVWQKRSIGAGVSFTIKGTQWRARCDAHERQARSEIGNEGKRSTTDTLEGTTATDFLRNFVEQTIKTQNLDYKDLIVVVFRDGVAESQLDECNRSEVQQIVTAAGGSLGAEVYFLVIQKATHARFLADMGNGEYLNPPAGTIIDKDLTFMNHTTFYLVPTTTSLSTSRPINYVVLYSPPNADIDTLQKFTFAMHWVYPNWTDAIKLPAPTQCAHKMAFLLGECGDMKPVINDRLKDSLFFL